VMLTDSKRILRFEIGTPRTALQAAHSQSDAEAARNKLTRPLTQAVLTITTRSNRRARVVFAAALPARW
jgi:hypothetical protein